METDRSMRALGVEPATVANQPLPDLRLLKLSIAIRWRRPYGIPGPIVANVLRGALGITLRKLVCPIEYFQDPCPPCPLYGGCAYGQVFAPSPSAEATRLSRQADLPRPFVLEPPGLSAESAPLAGSMTFGLTLFGRATQWLPWFVATLERLGAEGMGRDRMPFAIESIDAWHPAGNERLFTAGRSSLSLPVRRFSIRDFCQPSAQSLPGEPSTPRVRVEFATPLLLKTGSGLDARGRRIVAVEVRERPAFGVLVRRLRDRLSALAAFFGEPWQRSDFAELGQRADAVTLVDSRTVWLTRSRVSTRTGQTHELSGLVGEATYEFPSTASFREFWPLLEAGQYIHIGKNAPWGNGRLCVSLVEQHSRVVQTA